VGMTADIRPRVLIDEVAVLRAWEIRGEGVWGLVAHIRNRFGVERLAVLLDLGGEVFYQSDFCESCNVNKLVSPAVSSMLERGVERLEVTKAGPVRFYTELLLDVVAINGRIYVACYAPTYCKTRSGWCADRIGDTDQLRNLLARCGRKRYTEEELETMMKALQYHG